MKLSNEIIHLLTLLPNEEIGLVIKNINAFNKNEPTNELPIGGKIIFELFKISATKQKEIKAKRGW